LRLKTETAEYLPPVRAFGDNFHGSCVCRQ
jgi:hypothetical protein